MPRPVKITGRTSSVTNAFVNGIIPTRQPTEQEVTEVLRMLELSADDLRCCYCGDRATEWDRLRPLIAAKRPTGYISEIANLVPACGKCNQSKSGADWRKWMLGPARLSPRTRGIPDLDARVERLERFVAWSKPTLFDFEAAVGKDLWARHWANWEKLHALMHECEKTAVELRTAIGRAVKT
jgi:5-methylcytosine-specific restriction endonuclease McrA